jgi:hypothetical protein
VRSLQTVGKTEPNCMTVQYVCMGEFPAVCEVMGFGGGARREARVE